MGNSCLQRRRRRRTERAARHQQLTSQVLLDGISHFLHTSDSLEDTFGDFNVLEMLVGDSNVRLKHCLRIFIKFFDSNQHDTMIKFSLGQIHSFCQQEDMYLEVVKALIEEVPITESLACSIINLVITDGCLPTRDFVDRLHEVLQFPSLSTLPEAKQRNTFLVVVTFSDKLIGNLASSLITSDVIQALHSCLCRVLALDLTNKNISEMRDSSSTVFKQLQVGVAALLALQASIVTSENKSNIIKKLESEVASLGKSFQDILIELEDLYHLMTFGAVHEIGTLAQLLLDNYFDVSHRKKCYLRQDTSALNVVLSISDCTEAIKVLPSGLETRSDAFSFESIRSTFPVIHGSWYYEVTLVTEGIMQIGWTSRESKFFNHEGFGVGDDMESVGIDGSRKDLWFNAQPDAELYSPLPKWKAGDVVGCYIDIERKEVFFSLNGNWTSAFKRLFDSRTSIDSQPPVAYFAAVSLMSNQQCTFNFGRSPFSYPPKKPFENMNENGKLTPEQRVILPWVEIMRRRRVAAMAVDYSILCVICADEPATMTLLPCNHPGFCSSCPRLLSECPLCRSDITDVTVTC